MHENEVLSAEIRKIFEYHKGRYGSVRISETLKQNGISVNRKRVSKLMRNMKLLPKDTRYQYKRYNRESYSVERPNLLNQIFQTDGKNTLIKEDLRVLTPLIYNHINPYGNFELNMDERISILK